MRKNQLCADTKIENLASGIEVNLRPQISADRRFVQMKLHVAFHDVGSSVAPVQFVLPVQPQRSDLQKKSAAVPVLLSSQQTLVLDKTFTIPDGRTILFNAGTRSRNFNCCYGVPLLSFGAMPWCSVLDESLRPFAEMVRSIVDLRENPEEVSEFLQTVTESVTDVTGLDYLFRWGSCLTVMGEEQQPVQQLVLVTPQIIVRQEEEKHAPATIQTVTGVIPPPPADRCDGQEPASCPVCKACDAKVNSLLAKYHEACAAGRLAEAKEWASKALALDSTCFSKQPADATKARAGCEMPQP
jgi:hypothetical protein